MMASVPIPFRLPSPAQTPQFLVPSRTSSLKHSRLDPLTNEDRIYTTQFGLAAAQTSGEAPVRTWGSPNSTRRYSFIANDGPSGVVPMKSNRCHSLQSSSIEANMNRRSTDRSASMRNPMRAARIKRWAGVTRTVSGWDGLRRDPELWFENGDCLVHLYARGQSRRGPSFCVPFKSLRQSKCGAMISLCFAQTTPVPGSNPNDTGHVSSGLTTPVSKSNLVELYIPAPEDACKEASYQWHITTRNFFAFVFGKPLVGSHLGQALVELQGRMHLFRSGQIDNHSDFLDYAQAQGYRDVVDCADYALAMLYYAEHFKLRDLWIDAFVHCVGMNESLSLSQEFEPISRLTKALITKAYLEMDIHLGRVMRALGSFLEDDLSPAYLGLSDGGRAHLDRFRSFLHSFYVDKFGYWPPPRGVSFSKALYKSMYFDFKNLYDFLVELDSTSDLSRQKPASGGICVLQNVDTFDKRHDFIPLPHPLPLLPQYEPLTKRTQSQKTLRTLTLSSKQAKVDRYTTARAALIAATNASDASVTSCSIVQAYVRFEREGAFNQREEKVSMADARKIRWLLIYGTLQYLISAIRAPKEVRDTEDAEYPLCCLVTELSPWQLGTRVLTSPTVPSVNVPEAISSYLSESNYDVSGQLTPRAPQALIIQPDCQTDDYFTHTNPNATPSATRPVSVEVPAPLKISTPVARNTSARSLKRLSLSARSSRRNSLVVKPNPQPFCEILVHGYGNGLNEAIVDPPSGAISRAQSPDRSKRSSKSILPEGAGPETSWLRPSTPDRARSQARLSSSLEEPWDGAMLERARTPVFDSVQMDQLVRPVVAVHQGEPSSSADSMSSAECPFWSDEASSTSSKSSTNDVPLQRKKSSAEDSGLLGGLVPMGSTPVSNTKKPATKSTAPIRQSSRRNEFRFRFSSNLNSGDYGMTQTGGSPSTIVDSTIGVAFSQLPIQPVQAPASPPVAALSLDTITLVARKPSMLLSRSFSVGSLSPRTTSKKMRLGFATEALRTEGIMDIFSALSLSPSEVRAKEERPGGKTNLASNSFSTDAAPPAIPKVSHTAPKGVDSESEQGRKKEKRVSFWRR